MNFVTHVEPFPGSPRVLGAVSRAAWVGLCCVGCLGFLGCFSSGSSSEPSTSSGPQKPLEVCKEIKAESILQATAKSLGCIEHNKIPKEKLFVARTEQAYQELHKYKAPYQDCEGFAFPKVDFEKHTLVVAPLQGQCELRAQNRLCDTEKGVVWELTALSKGTCELHSHASQWLVIPKLAAETSVKLHYRTQKVVETSPGKKSGQEAGNKK